MVLDTHVLLLPPEMLIIGSKWFPLLPTKAVTNDVTALGIGSLYVLSKRERDRGQHWTG